MHVAVVITSKRTCTRVHVDRVDHSKEVYMANVLPKTEVRGSLQLIYLELVYLTANLQ